VANQSPSEVSIASLRELIAFNGNRFLQGQGPLLTWLKLYIRPGSVGERPPEGEKETLAGTKAPKHSPVMLETRCRLYFSADFFRNPSQIQEKKVLSEP
jgi:hypothetical protein